MLRRHHVILNVRERGMSRKDRRCSKYKRRSIPSLDGLSEDDASHAEPLKSRLRMRHLHNPHRTEESLNWTCRWVTCHRGTQCPVMMRNYPVAYEHDQQTVMERHLQPHIRRSSKTGVCLRLHLHPQHRRLCRVEQPLTISENRLHRLHHREVRGRV